MRLLLSALFGPVRQYLCLLLAIAAIETRLRSTHNAIITHDSALLSGCVFVRSGCVICIVGSNHLAVADTVGSGSARDFLCNFVSCASLTPSFVAV